MILLFTSLMANLALAQDGGFDAHGFRLAAYDADLRDPLTLQRPGQFVGGSWFAGGLLEYAKSPLVLQSGLTGERRILLDNVLTANTSMGVALHRNLRVDLSTPLYLASRGAAGPQGVGLGDIRLAMMAAVGVEEAGGAWGFGLVPFLDLPTGNTANFLGQRRTSGGLTGALTRELGPLTLSGNLGLQFNPAIDVINISGADSLLFGVSGGYLLTEKTSTTLEFRSQWAMSGSGKPGTNSPGELLASMRHQSSGGGFLTGGLATAATPGVGAAAFRLLVGGGWGQLQAADHDLDDDGIVDRVDRCPETPEDVNDYLDADGCPDALPSLEIGVLRDDEPAPEATLSVIRDGEVLPTDWGGSPVTVQSLPGVSWTAEASLGDCLAGRVSTVMADGEAKMNVALEPSLGIVLRVKFMDVDGVPVSDLNAELGSEEAACSVPGALEIGDQGSASSLVGPGVHTVSVSGAGFLPGQAQISVVMGDEPVLEMVVQREPKPMVAPTDDEPTVRVRIEPTRIAILEPIHFKVGRSELKSTSFDVLQEMASLILNTPEVGVVTVSGHTDSEGSEGSNQRLSEARAQAVVDHLHGVGVPLDRLASKGFGESQPIAPNRTPGGRALNRRVAFDLEPK